MRTSELLLDIANNNPWNSSADANEHFHSSSLLSYHNKLEHNYAQGICPREYSAQEDEILEASSDNGPDFELMTTSEVILDSDPWGSSADGKEQLNFSSMLSYRNNLEHYYAQGISPREYNVQGDEIMEASSDSAQECKLMTTSDAILNTANSQHLEFKTTLIVLSWSYGQNCKNQLF